MSPPGKPARTHVDLRGAADVVAIVRRSLLGVRGAASAGTGWVVLGNGLVMTSHEAVGYEATVVLELESGRRCEGRVIWVDVARDLALVLPAEALPLPPLLARPDLPRLGEPALALSAVPDSPWRVVSAVVSAVDYRVGPLRCFEIDAPASSVGGPIVDLDGRVIGIGGLDLPRGTRRHAEGGAASLAAPGARSLAVPIVALSRALAAVDVGVEQFEGRGPTYRCPSCNEPFSHPGRALPRAAASSPTAGRAQATPPTAPPAPAPSASCATSSASWAPSPRASASARAPSASPPRARAPTGARPPTSPWRSTRTAPACAARSRSCACPPRTRSRSTGSSSR